jgi:hypothetical protein
MSKRNRNSERRVDDAVDRTFPASDPITAGAATGTEPPRRPVDRKAPLLRKEDVEQAQTAAGRAEKSKASPAPNRPGANPWLTFLAFAALLLILGSAAAFMVEGWQRAGAQMSIHGWIALVLGVVLSLVIGCGLMALMFYSSRKGYDEHPEREQRPRQVP